MPDVTPSLIVRRAVPADASVVEALYRQLVSNPAVAVLPERVAQLADDPNTALLVCERDGHVVGTALVALCADVMFRQQPFAVVENVVVDEPTRGVGVGTAIVRAIEDFACRADCSKIILLSATKNEAAHRLFERVGFVGSTKRGFVKYRRHFGVKEARDREYVSR
jgi:GNAT superfamily N-acetyltransferase